MLEDLTIKDFALITSSRLEFGEGFTVLSGETGAGKSILIGALSFLLGGKAETRMIRGGAHEAAVTGTFTIGEGSEDAADGGGFDTVPSAPLNHRTEQSDGGRVFSSAQHEKMYRDHTSDDEDARPLSAAEWLLSRGIEAEDGRVLVRRVLKESGKSAAWIGGVPVTRTDLAAFSALLVDIHGQHDHQLLMKVSEHRRFLDAIAGIEGEVKSFTTLYAELVEKRRKIAQISSNAQEMEREKSMLSFALQEIDGAQLHDGEDEELEDEENRLSSYEKLCSSIEEVTGALEEAVNNIKTARRASHHATEADKTLETLDNRLEASFYETEDIAGEFAAYKDRLVFDPARLAQVQDRLLLISSLKKKYASSPAAPLSEVINYAAEAKSRLASFETADGDRSQLEAEVKQLEAKVYDAAKSLSTKRKAAGTKMAHEVEAVLQHLGMTGTHFCVRVSDKGASGKEQRCSPYGMDDVEFLISANVAAPLMPLAEIASGGELSRVMLAMKTVIAERDPVPTLVFDEIDTGIGGEVAVAVGGHLRDLASFKQILCITHLASIAVYADNQIKIEKAVQQGATVSACRTVTGLEREKEIARMLSGEQSEEAVGHARAMLAKHRRK